MHSSTTSQGPQGPHRPRALTVFGAAFVAGAAAAFGVNRVLDVHLAQAKPQVESEPIFVALRSLPQGAPVTVWDVALRDWPKAMLPTSALRADDSFDGCVLRHPLREGQPLLSVQLVRGAPATATADSAPIVPFVAPTPAVPAPEQDTWLPADAAASTLVPSSTTVPPATTLPPDDAIALELLNIASPEPLPPVSQPRPEVAVPPETSAPSATPTTESGPAAVAESDPATEPPVSTVVADPSATEAPVDPAPPVTAEPQPEEVAATTDAVVVATEPTPAPGASIDPAVEPAPTASVLERTPLPAADEVPPRSRPQHLVVPERIARQADSSFIDPILPSDVPVDEEPAVVATAERPEPTLRPVAEPEAATPTQPAQVNRPAARQNVRASAKPNAPRATSRPGQAAPTRKPAAAPRKQPAQPARGLGGFLPSFGSLVPGLAAPAPRADEAVATDDPATRRPRSR